MKNKTKIREDPISANEEQISFIAWDYDLVYNEPGKKKTYYMKKCDINRYIKNGKFWDNINDIASPIIVNGMVVYPVEGFYITEEEKIELMIQDAVKKRILKVSKK